MMNPASRLLCMVALRSGAIRSDAHSTGLGRSARQQHRFGVGEVFGLAVDHDDIAIAQDGIPGRLTAHDPLPPHARERHLRAPAAYIIAGCGPTAHAPGGTTTETICSC